MANIKEIVKRVILYSLFIYIYICFCLILCMCGKGFSLVPGLPPIRELVTPTGTDTQNASFVTEVNTTPQATFIIFFLKYF